MGISLEHVDFSYKKVNYKKRKILNNIDLKIQDACITGIIGSTGSGKSTLLELCTHLLSPEEGKVIVTEDTKAQLGFVFQNPDEQFVCETVREELESQLMYFQYKVDQKEKRVLDALKMVELDVCFLNRKIKDLSYGEKKKLSLASILMINPKILVLDEPTKGLDDLGEKNFIKLLRLLKNRYHKTIIIVSHDTDFLHKIVDYVYVIYDHKIVLEGMKYDVFKQVKLLRKYGVEPPKVIVFSDLVYQKKKVRIGYRDEINDLIKDIYRYVK